MRISFLAQAPTSYLLDPSFEKDAPIPIFKHWTHILRENWIPVLLLLLTILLGIAIWYFLKNRKQKGEEKIEATPTDPYEDAIQAISALQNKKSLAPKPLVFRLSEILRVYVEKLFHLPAMELTGEEFIREVAGHSFFKDRYEESLQNFIQQGDQIKYSKQEVTEETTNQLLQLALHLVKDTKQKLDEEQKTLEVPSQATPPAK